MSNSKLSSKIFKLEKDSNVNHEGSDDNESIEGSIHDSYGSNVIYIN